MLMVISKKFPLKGMVKEMIKAKAKVKAKAKEKEKAKEGSSLVLLLSLAPAGLGAKAARKVGALMAVADLTSAKSANSLSI